MKANNRIRDLSRRTSGLMYTSGPECGIGTLQGVRLCGLTRKQKLSHWRTVRARTPIPTAPKPAPPPPNPPAAYTRWTQPVSFIRKVWTWIKGAFGLR